MSLQWTLVATFLYVEIAVVILLLLPIISARRWQRFFKSRFLKSLEAQANMYFFGFLLILILLFVDSIREMRRYSLGRVQDAEHGHLNAELAHSMKLFRAQRNFYIAGFALFLCLVIRRIVSLLSSTATFKAELEAVMKQAKSASQAAQNLLSEQKEKTGKIGGDYNLEIKQEDVQELKNKLIKVKEELARARVERDAIKKQAESVSKEYDRLTEEYSKVCGSTGTKKDD